MTIEEGRLVERRCPHCGGTERRAFGEFVGVRGELASYAIGWTAEHEDVVAHMTIGIGAGNEGGGSFHIQVMESDGAAAMGLVDEPFEDVPEGGPDLTRHEALAHEDLPFVWFVADQVMGRDRRAWWMEAWVLGTGAFVTSEVLNRTAPVLHVVHTSDDTWQLLSATPDDVEPEAHLTHLWHVLDEDRSLLDVLDLEPGERADRSAAGAPWEREPDDQVDA